MPPGADFQHGTQGHQTPQGPQGPQGAQILQGSQGPNGGFGFPSLPPNHPSSAPGASYRNPLTTQNHASDGSLTSATLQPNNSPSGSELTNYYKQALRETSWAKIKLSEDCIPVSVEELQAGKLHQSTLQELLNSSVKLEFQRPYTNPTHPGIHGRMIWLSSAHLATAEGRAIESLIHFPLLIDQDGKINAPIYPEFQGHIPPEFQAEEYEQYNGSAGSTFYNWEYIERFTEQNLQFCKQSVNAGQVEHIKPGRFQLVKEFRLVKHDYVYATKALQQLLGITKWIGPAYLDLTAPKNTQTSVEILDDIEIKKVLSSQHLSHISRDFPLASSQRRAVHSVLEDQNKKSRVSSISGPPGTGKTTLVASLVAQKIVESCIAMEVDKLESTIPAHRKHKGNAVPPEIIGAAYSHEAAHRLIEAVQFHNPKLSAQSHSDSQTKTAWDNRFLPDTTVKTIQEGVGTRKVQVIFDGKQNDDGTSEDRPLPDLAVNMIKDESDRKKHHIKSQRVFGGDQNNLFAASGYVLRARDYFLAKLNQALSTTEPQITSLSEAWSKLHTLTQETKATIKKFVGLLYNAPVLHSGPEDVCRLLSELNDLLYKLLPKSHHELADKYISKHRHGLDKIVSKCRFGNQSNSFTQTQLKELRLACSEYFEGLLDITLRVDLFWYSVHMLEVLWLQHCKLIGNNQPAPNNPSFNFLFPFLVGTAFFIPRCYASDKDDSYRAYRDAQMLIFDEASLALPHIGIPTFALTEHAVVLGDNKQLPAIQNLEPWYHQKLLNQYSTSATIEHVEKYKLSAGVEGNLMLAAQKLSAWKHTTDSSTEDEGGLLLVEHYRCYPEIIKFCNDFFYHGLLKPMRPSAFLDPDNPDKETLPLQKVYVKNSACTVEGTSRFNPEELKCILQWLDSNKERLLTKFKTKKNKPRKLSEIVCVITPFKEQRRRLNEEFQRHKDYKDIVVDTVHAIQGAERPVVLFSTVYGQNYSEKLTMIEEHLHLMNVAVSRAQNQFVIFGAAKHLNADIPVFKCFNRAFYDQFTKLPVGSKNYAQLMHQKFADEDVVRNCAAATKDSGTREQPQPRKKKAFSFKNFKDRRQRRDS